MKSSLHWGQAGWGKSNPQKTMLRGDVTIKVLPSHLTANSELKQRLDREVKAISKLSQPNICTLHDIGNENGLDFLVMDCERECAGTSLSLFLGRMLDTGCSIDGSCISQR